MLDEIVVANHSASHDLGELNTNLSKLTMQLARLVSRMDKQESVTAHCTPFLSSMHKIISILVDALAKQLVKSSDLANKQFMEIMNAMAHPSGGHPGTNCKFNFDLVA